jgi:hypothetical protein
VVKTGFDPAFEVRNLSKTALFYRLSRHTARAAERRAGDGAWFRPTLVVAADNQPDGGNHGC